MDAPFATLKRKMHVRLGVFALFIHCLLSAQPPQPPHHLFFHVKFQSQPSPMVSGRLLVFLAPGSGATSLAQTAFQPGAAYVAAKEVHDVAGGSVVDVDTDDVAYPSGFSTLAAGAYQAEAVLDVNHTYNYTGLAAGDLRSSVVRVPHFDPQSSQQPVLPLTEVVPAPTLESLPASVHQENFTSPSLSAFYHRPIQIRALVVEPPHYAESRNRFAACYYTHGFGGTLDNMRHVASMFADDMGSGKLPPMFWILLDESLPTGTHEFADSANNGPWGHALTTEFIPYLESRYRLDRRSGARFLNGHSSGGWATLWLQVTYPKIFGGTWSTSPDPSDFHDFTGVDLYAPHANIYYRPDGSAYPLVRENGKVVATIKQFASLEQVLGPYGGQFASFEWVFSPKGPDGTPQQVFDRTTGNINPAVVDAWKRYDIALTLQDHWPQLAPNLNGKIHVYVGTADTFYLDGAAHKLDTVLKQLGARAQVTFVEGRTHMNLYRVGDDPHGLFAVIAKQMYSTWQQSAKK